MGLTPQDVRDVRFGTTRLRAGYSMAEVDAFLDIIESAVETYEADSRHLRDEADALRSQLQQIQTRLSAVQAELEECRALPPADSSDQKDTIITPIERNADSETTAENPIIGSSSDIELAALRKVRQDVQNMLREQLQLVENLRIDLD